MPDITLQVGIQLAFVGAFTVATAVSDLRSRRIPNAMTVPMFVLGLIYQAVFHQWAGLADAGWAFAMGFGILLVLWLVGGGGRHNRVILSELRYRLSGAVEPVEAVGWRGDALEAQAFAFLAARSLAGLPLSYPQTTGVSQPVTGGVRHVP